MKALHLDKLCLEHLGDTTTYEKLKKDPSDALRHKVNKPLKDILTKHDFSTTSINNLQTPTTARTQHFYGLPKTHKTNLKIRPIVSACGGSLIALAGFYSSCWNHCSLRVTQKLTWTAHATDFFARFNAIEESKLSGTIPISFQVFWKKSQVKKKWTRPMSSAVFNPTWARFPQWKELSFNEAWAGCSDRRRETLYGCNLRPGRRQRAGTILLPAYAGSVQCMPSGRHANAFPQPACDHNGCRCLDPWCNGGVGRELWPSVGTCVHSEIQCAVLHRHEGFQGSSSNVLGDRPDTWPNTSWCAATPRVPIPGWRCRPEWSSGGTASLPGRSRGHKDRGRRFRCPMRRSVGGVTTPIPSHAGRKLSRRFSWCSRHLQHRSVFSLCSMLLLTINRRALCKTTCSALSCFSTTVEKSELPSPLWPVKVFSVCHQCSCVFSLCTYPQNCADSSW